MKINFDSKTLDNVLEQYVSIEQKDKYSILDLSEALERFYPDYRVIMADDWEGEIDPDLAYDKATSLELRECFEHSIIASHSGYIIFDKEKFAQLCWDYANNKDERHREISASREDILITASEDFLIDEVMDHEEIFPKILKSDHPHAFKYRNGDMIVFKLWLPFREKYVVNYALWSKIKSASDLVSLLSNEIDIEIANIHDRLSKSTENQTADITDSSEDFLNIYACEPATPFDGDESPWNKWSFQHQSNPQI